MWHSTAQPSIIPLVAFIELTQLNDLLEDVSFLFSTNQRAVPTFVITHTPLRTTYGQQYMFNRLHLLKRPSLILSICNKKKDCKTYNRSGTSLFLTSSILFVHCKHATGSKCKIRCIRLNKNTVRNGRWKYQVSCTCKYLVTSIRILVEARENKLLLLETFCHLINQSVLRDLEELPLLKTENFWHFPK